MTPAVYQVLAVYAGEWLVERERQPLVLGRDPLPPGGHAVYVAEGRDGTVLYVGSTARMRDPYGTRARLGVHLTERAKRFSWDSGDRAQAPGRHAARRGAPDRGPGGA